MTNKKTIPIMTGITSIAIVLLLSLYGALNLTEKAIDESNTIDLGAIFILTGVGSTYGEDSLKGAQIAIEEINQKGGINGKELRITFEDNEGLAVNSVKAYKKLTSQGIEIIIGPTWSPSGQALAPLACEDKTLMISPSLGIAEFNEACDNIFNLWPHDDELSKNLGKYLYEEGFRNIAILGSLQVWEQAQAEAVKTGFEKAGGKVVSYQIALADEQSFRTEATKIKNSNAEAIVFTNLGFEHLAAKRIREIGVDVPFYSVLLDQTRIDGAEGAFENAIAVTSFTPSDAFRKKFIEKYGNEPEAGADTSYDAVMLIAEAIRETGVTNPSKISEYLRALAVYNGESGELKFDEFGGVTKQSKFLQVKDNKLVEYITNPGIQTTNP